MGVLENKIRKNTKIKNYELCVVKKAIDESIFLVRQTHRKYEVIHIWTSFGIIKIQRAYIDLGHKEASAKEVIANFYLDQSDKLTYNCGENIEAAMTRLEILLE